MTETWLVGCEGEEGGVSEPVYGAAAIARAGRLYNAVSSMWCREEREGEYDIVRLPERVQVSAFPDKWAVLMPGPWRHKLYWDKMPHVRKASESGEVGDVRWALFEQRVDAEVCYLRELLYKREAELELLKEASE